MATTSDRRAWLAELYEANAKTVLAYCRRFLKNTEDAADASQEVFIRGSASLHAAPTSLQARRWLIIVARNYCLDMVRRRRRFQAAVTTLAAELDAQPPCEAEILNRELLQTVMAELDKRERLALWQATAERRPLAEVANSLGLSYMAAAQLVHRARKHASMVAANLAGVLLLGGQVMRRRVAVPNFGQAVAALAVIPVVVGVAIATASTAQGHPPIVSRFGDVKTVGRTSSAGEARRATSRDGGGKAHQPSLDPSDLKPPLDPVDLTLRKVGQAVGRTTRVLPTIPGVPTIGPVQPTPLVPTPSPLPTR